MDVSYLRILLGLARKFLPTVTISSEILLVGFLLQFSSDELHVMDCIPLAVFL